MSIDARFDRRMDLQNKEFDTLTALAAIWQRLHRTAVVDDAYPAERRHYEGALQDFVDALDANGRRAREQDHRASQDYLWPDRRHINAQKFVAEILHIVEQHFSDEDRRRRVIRILAEELFDAAWKAGVYLLTDADRAEAGLPERNFSGWTPEELLTLEAKKLEALLRPAPLILR